MLLLAVGKSKAEHQQIGQGIFKNAKTATIILAPCALAPILLVAEEIYASPNWPGRMNWGFLVCIFIYNLKSAFFPAKLMSQFRFHIWGISLQDFVTWLLHMFLILNSWYIKAHRSSFPTKIKLRSIPLISDRLKYQLFYATIMIYNQKTCHHWWPYLVRWSSTDQNQINMNPIAIGFLFWVKNK